MAPRTSLAVLFTSLCSGGLVAIAGVAFSLITSPGPLNPHDSLQTFAIGFLAGLSITTTFGMAWHAFATQRGLVHFPAYMMAGALIGSAVLLPISLIILALSRGAGDFTMPASDAIFLELFGLMVGAASASVGWLIRRPDRTT